MVQILQKGDKRLREIAKPVLLREIASPKIKKIISDMKEALRSQDDAVAIAAPQIGAPLRIFLVSGKVFQKSPKLSPNEAESNSSTKKFGKNSRTFENYSKDRVFINPEIVKRSKKEVYTHEGCLSVRWLYGEVKRAEKVTLRAYNERGERFTRGASGLLAQIFQHEVEHLDGKLFTDKARNIEEIPPEKTRVKN